MSSTIDPIISAATTGSQTDASGSLRLPTQTLGQDDFLKLLVTQLSSQDPMNPISDTGFIAQMAQFSALEQARTMESDMAQMRDDQQVLQANSLLGRTVQLQVDPKTIGYGTVDAVLLQAGTPQLIVNGQSYDLSQVLSIAQTPTQP